MADPATKPCMENTILGQLVPRTSLEASVHSLSPAHHDAPHIGHGCVFLAPAREIEVNSGWVNLRVLLFDSPEISGGGSSNPGMQGYRDTGMQG